MFAQGFPPSAVACGPLTQVLWGEIMKMQHQNSKLYFCDGIATPLLRPRDLSPLNYQGARVDRSCVDLLKFQIVQNSLESYARNLQNFVTTNERENNWTIIRTTMKKSSVKLLVCFVYCLNLSPWPAGVSFLYNKNFEVGPQEAGPLERISCPSLLDETSNFKPLIMRTQLVFAVSWTYFEHFWQRCPLSGRTSQRNAPNQFWGNSFTSRMSSKINLYFIKFVFQNLPCAAVVTFQWIYFDVLTRQVRSVMTSSRKLRCYLRDVTTQICDVRTAAKNGVWNENKMLLFSTNWDLLSGAKCNSVKRIFEQWRGAAKEVKLFSYWSLVGKLREKTRLRAKSLVTALSVFPNCSSFVFEKRMIGRLEQSSFIFQGTTWYFTLAFGFTSQRSKRNPDLDYSGWEQRAPALP